MRKPKFRRGGVKRRGLGSPVYFQVGSGRADWQAGRLAVVAKGGTGTEPSRCPMRIESDPCTIRGSPLGGVSFWVLQWLCGESFLSLFITCFPFIFCVTLGGVGGIGRAHHDYQTLTSPSFI